jgi:hypothetical protein
MLGVISMPVFLDLYIQPVRYCEILYRRFLFSRLETGQPTGKAEKTKIGTQSVAARRRAVVQTKAPPVKIGFAKPRA